MKLLRAGYDGAPPPDSPAPCRARPTGTNRVAIAVLLACLAPALPLTPPAGAQGTESPPSLVLSPSNVRTEAASGLALGPFGLANETSATFSVRVLPVLVDQDRGGGVIVRDDQRSLRRARRFLAAGTRSFHLPPGAQRSSAAIVRRVPPSASFYGGLLFEARPRGVSDRQVVDVLRLNASVLLDPPPAERRVRLSTEEMRAEQAGKRWIRLLVPVTNRGNAYLPADGEARVVDDQGRTRATADLTGVEILPAATVDVRGRIGADLPPGAYSLRGTATMEAESVQARGEMLIGADGRVELRAASLLEAPAPAPAAYLGEPVELRATYRNEGNVRFAPDAQVRVRPVLPEGVGEIEATQRLESEAAEPGESADVAGSVELPGEAQRYELEIVLADGERELDSRSVSVTPQAGQARAGLLDRIGDRIRRSALLLVLALGALLVALGVGALQYVRRVRASAGGASPIPPPTEPEPAAPPPRPEVASVGDGNSRKLREPADRPRRAALPRLDPVLRRPQSAPGSNGPAKVSLANATFADLRALGMSTTQANRVLRYRDQRGGFSSVDELDEVPGFPAHLRAEVKRSLVE